MVAIDGPAGAGKSTVTRRVAEKLGYFLLGTGALYRAVALAACRRGIPWDDSAGVGCLARELMAPGGLRVAPDCRGEQRTLIGDEDVTDELLREALGEGASRVSLVPAVREALLDVQRRAGENGGLVVEGRDVTTVVFPDAEAKFYLTATVEVRALRRYRQLLARGLPANLEEIRADVAARDHRDSSRPVAPLRQAPDAVLVDSSALTLEEVVAEIVAAVQAIEASLAPGSRR